MMVVVEWEMSTEPAQKTLPDFVFSDEPGFWYAHLKRMRNKRRQSWKAVVTERHVSTL